MIKAILFDYFGVIRGNTYWRHMRQNKAVKHGFPELSDQLNSGEITWQDFVNELADITGQSAMDIDKKYKQARLDTDMVAFIAQLHKRFKTALVTNSHHEFIEPFLRESHLDSIFDEVVVSSRTGSVKPDPAIYRYALEVLKVKPGEAVFIDDSSHNIEGAVKVGMHGILYTDLPSLRAELTKVIARSNVS